MKLTRALPVLGVALVIGGIAFFARKRKPVAAPPPPAALAVQFSGCARVERGPVCFIRDKQRLTLFVPSTATGASFRTSDGPVRVIERVLVDDGARYAVELPLGPLALSVDLGDTRFTLRLGAAKDSEQLERAKTLRAQGKTEEAERLLRSGLEALPDVEQGRRKALLGRILVARGKQSDGQPLLKEAAASAERAGRVSEAVEDALALAFAHIVYERKFSLSRDQLTFARRLASEAGGLETARVAYYDGLLANATGDRKNALEFFREARAHAQRLDIHPLSELVSHQLALSMSDLGRMAEGVALLRGVFPRIEDDVPCNRLVAHTDIAWLLLIAHRDHAPIAIRTEAESHLQKAATDAQGCKDPLRALELQVAKAEWALATEDPKATKREIDAMKPFASHSSPKLTLWRIDLEAREMLLEQNAPGAKKHFEREAELANASLDTEGHWRSQLGLAAALTRLGRKREAIEAYRVAEADLDRMLVSVPLSEGRDSFAGARERSARSLVALLVAENQPKEALSVARWARIRALRSAAQIGRVSQLSSKERARWDEAIGKYREERVRLEAEAQNDWKLPSDALDAARTKRANAEMSLRGHLNSAYGVISADREPNRRLSIPAEEELYLVFFPGERGFMAFALDARGVEVESIGDIDHKASLGALAERILSPFAQRIRRAKRIRLFTYGDVRALDLHALPFDGAPLAHQRTVEYALDIEASPNRPGVGMLVVADPQGDLPRARIEAETLQRELSTRNDVKLTTRQGEGATRERFLADMANVRWLHFAGHGTFSDINGADSALELNDGRVTVGDVLALPHVPELAVLNACDAARETGWSSSESFGVAQAFLVRGAKGVIAPTRSVSDELSQLLASELYKELRRDPDPAVALNRATATVAKTHPLWDWAAFRAFSP